MGIVSDLLGKIGLGNVSVPFGGAANKSVVGIDIGSSSIKVVQLRKEHGKAILETYGALALGPYAKEPVGAATRLSVDAIAAALSDVLREAHVTATRAGVAVPYSASLASVIEMPQMSQEELQRAIPLEARKYIPIPLTDVMLDWYVIPDDDTTSPADTRGADTKQYQKGHRVLLVAIRKDTLAGYQTIIEKAGLTPVFYELEVFAGVRSGVTYTTASTMLIDIGAAASKVSIIDRGIVHSSHTVPLGGQDITRAISRALAVPFEKAEELKRQYGLMGSTANAESMQVRTAALSTLGRVFPDAHKVLLEYGRKFMKNVPHVVLIGGGASLRGIEEEAHMRLGVDVSRARPFTYVESPAFLVDILTEVGPEFAVAVGGALRALEE
jgi:type IV pilus assembly protein PilM